MDELTIDFSQDQDFEVIKGKVLTFMKDRSIVDGETVHCTIHQHRASKINQRFPFLAGVTIETLADTIAEFLAAYAKGKDGLIYSSVTISVQ